MTLTQLAALDAAELQTDPFDYIVVPDFLSPAQLKLVNADYPEISTATNHELDDLHYGPRFAEVLQELETDEFKQHLGDKFNVDLSESPTTVTVRKYCERTDGHIHRDHASKLITMLLYFNEEWDSDGGCLRMLRSPSNLEDYTAEVKPMGGTLLAFRRTNHSWHGHKQFVGERRMLQYNFLSPGTLPRFFQKLSRATTHFGKRVLGLR
jgi:Rps23 Pro-64 3,4-dihydroxylase Tpa1-like proline 4-hydroxylase